MSTTEYTIVYDQGPTSWGAYVEELPGCFAVGETREQCERLIKEAIALHIDALHRHAGDSAVRQGAAAPSTQA
jgi:predicted RNase H-like HicB family nuclease